MKNDLPVCALRNPKSGIALIIVLGFLSILIIMAVGFAISMRVERLVSRTSLDHIKSRQLGEAALARVVWDINQSVGDAMVPDWNGSWAGGVMESLGTGLKATNMFSGSSLLSGYVTSYVPRSVWNNATVAADNAEWLPFEYVDNGTTKRVGQYAYLIIDCSGLLDVNFDHSSTNNIARSRSFGETVYELQLTNSLLSELDSRATNIMWGRVGANGQSVEKPWGRLESLAEITPILSRGFGGQAPLKTDNPNYNFSTYSRIPSGYLSGGTVKQPVAITDPLDQSTLTAAFTDLGLPDASGFYNNLRDYTDSDNVPVNVDSYCTEAVPLINEIVVSNSYVDVHGDGTEYRNQYRLLTEIWYPFTTVNSNVYALRMIGQYQGANPPPNLPVINETITMAAPGGTWSAGDFLVVTSTPQTIVTNILQSLASVKVRASARVLQGGVEVDRVGGSGATLLELDIGSRISGFGNFSFGKEADDPRLNWNGADATQWKTVVTHSLRTTNSGLTFANAGADGHFYMYVANRPLKAVGELGLMLYSATKPWQTLSLLQGPNFFPVLDRFTLNTNEVRHGLVNPNGYNTNVIATVFNRMPVDRVPGDPAATNFNLTQLLAVGRRFANKNIALTNSSDLSHLAPELTAAVPGLSSAYFESVARNSAGLFAPRQQLFTVVLAAQVQDDDLNVLAEQTGVGLIWRDPYIVSNNTHATMVRNFRWLTE